MITHDGSGQKLERVARQRLEDLGYPLAACWKMVVRGIENDMLDADEVQSTLDHLKRGQDYHPQEVGFEAREEEVSPDVWEKKMRISLFGEVVYGPFEEMMQEMQRLLDAYHRPD